MARMISRRQILVALAAGARAARASVCQHYDTSNPPGIEGFEGESRTAGSRTHSLFRIGQGPAVFVLHEIPGLYRADIDLARRMAKCGFTAYVPLFFGKPGECHPVRNLLTKPLNPASEFSYWLPQTPPAVHWLRPQLDFAYRRSGGRGVALIGMCLTGSLPLAVISSTIVKAAVICQPTNPFLFPWLTDLSGPERRALCSSTADVLGFHFSHDRYSPEARWSTLHRYLGNRLTEMIIDSDPGNAGGVATGAHSTLAGDGMGPAQEIAFQLAVRYIDNRISDTPTHQPFPNPGEPLPPGFKIPHR